MVPRVKVATVSHQSMFWHTLEKKWRTGQRVLHGILSGQLRVQNVLLLNGLQIIEVLALHRQLTIQCFHRLDVSFFSSSIV